MKTREWASLRIINFNDPKDKRKLKKGDKFLYGKNMISQKENKKIGDDISYFQIIDVKKGGNIEYVLKNDILEEEK